MEIVWEFVPLPGTMCLVKPRTKNILNNNPLKKSKYRSGFNTVLFMYMVEDPEHVGVDPEGDVGLVVDSGVAGAAPGHHPHLVGDRPGLPHDGPSVVSGTSALAEHVRPSCTDVHLIDDVVSGVPYLAIIQGRASDGQLVQVDNFQDKRFYNNKNDQ